MIHLTMLLLKEKRTHAFWNYHQEVLITTVKLSVQDVMSLSSPFAFMGKRRQTDWMHQNVLQLRKC